MGEWKIYRMGCVGLYWVCEYGVRTSRAHGMGAGTKRGKESDYNTSWVTISGTVLSRKRFLRSNMINV